MALISCSECGKEISDQAVSCPNCGYPMKEQALKENIGGQNVGVFDITSKKRKNLKPVIIPIIIIIVLAVF